MREPLDADRPALRVAEDPSIGDSFLGRGIHPLLDHDGAAGLPLHPQPNSSSLSSSNPKWWAISCTTVTRICSSSSSRAKSRSKGPRKIVILDRKSVV